MNKTGVVPKRYQRGTKVRIKNFFQLKFYLKIGFLIENSPKWIPGFNNTKLKKTGDQQLKNHWYLVLQRKFKHCPIHPAFYCTLDNPWITHG
jgi:hypothetical protein